VTEALAYLNGRTVRASEACLPVYDAGVVLGASVSELCRTFRKRLDRLDDHLDRFLRTLRLARMEIDVGVPELRAISERLVAHNGPLLPEGSELGLVLFATGGEVSSFSGMLDRPLRAGPTLCVHTFPLAFALYAPLVERGARLVTPSVRQVPPACWDPRMKCRSRMHYFLADREAREKDPQATALLLDLDGYVTETSTANFLMVKAGTIVSPPGDRVLPGISRSVVGDLAARLGIPDAERLIPLEEVLRAEEAFLTSTPYCLAPVSHVNGAPIGAGVPGPVYLRLAEAWSAEVGLDIRKQILEAARK
jgi:branched-subunit amino acid aminotransferase/4-amino-4-deoxychorismate lyase